MSEENENIKKAKEVLEEISDDEDVAEMAWKREIFLMDQKAIRSTGYREGREDGLAEGKTQGLAEGRTQGIAEKQKEIAKKMLEENIDINVIINCTGLSKEEIEKLK